MPIAKTKVIEIEITEAQEKFLKEFAEKQYIGAKDNLSTICPIHVVQDRRERVVNPDYDKVDRIIYHDSELNLDLNALEEIIEHYYEEEDINFSIIPYEEAKDNKIKGSDGKEYYIYDEDDYLIAYGINHTNIEKIHVGYYYENVAYFFIRDEAKDYMRYQSHNLISPRIYTFGPGYSNCGDYVPFWNLLMSIGQKLNEVKGNEAKEEILIN